jgi:peptide/nickel transport system permease protein
MATVQFRQSLWGRQSFIRLSTMAELPRLLSWSGVALLAVVTVVALSAPILAPHDPIATVAAPFLPPGHGGLLLGSDTVGRDVMSRVLYGMRISWFAALAVVGFGMLFGGTVGLIAGSSGGWIDDVLMRITDLFLALPAPVMAIAIGAALGPGLFHTLLAVSVVWWPFYARVIRGEVRRLAARPHIEAARLSGTGRIRLVARHILPGALPTAVVTGSLDIGGLILTLAGLSFLGLGQAAPAPELGADSARTLTFLLQYWWIPIMPGIAVMILALVGNIAGDSVRNLLERS